MKKMLALLLVSLGPVVGCIDVADGQDYPCFGRACGEDPPPRPDATPAPPPPPPVVIDAGAPDVHELDAGTCDDEHHRRHHHGHKKHHCKKRHHHECGDHDKENDLRGAR